MSSRPSLGAPPYTMAVSSTAATPDKVFSPNSLGVGARRRHWVAITSSTQFQLEKVMVECAAPLPTPAPSRAPTTSPTPSPSILPTSIPTPPPTPIPELTAPPTSTPTTAPTSPPTPIPSLRLPFFHGTSNAQKTKVHFQSADLPSANDNGNIVVLGGIVAVALAIGVANFVLKTVVNHNAYGSRKAKDHSTTSRKQVLSNLQPGRNCESRSGGSDDEQSTEESTPILQNHTPTANWSGLDLYTDGRIDDVHD